MSRMALRDPSRIELLVETGIILADVFEVPSDGKCFFWSVDACSNLCEQLHITTCPPILPTPDENRHAVCNFLMRNADNQILVGGTTPRKRVETMYGESARNREKIVDPDYSQKIAELRLDPTQYPQYVNTFEEWVLAMREPRAFVDEVIVEAAALCFGFCFKVYTRSISMAVDPEETGDECFDSLVRMGFSSENTSEALSNTGGNHARALEILLSLPQQPSQPPPNLWRVQTYNPDGFICNLLNDRDHYRFLYLQGFIPFVAESDEVALAPLSSPRLLPSPAAAGGGIRVDSRRIRLPSPPSSPSPSPSPPASRSHSPSQQPSCILTLPRCTLNRDDPKSFLKGVKEYAISRQVHLTGSFFVSALCLTLLDLQEVFQIFGSFPIGPEKYRVIACMFDNGGCVQYAGSPKDLSQESEKRLFSSEVASVLSDPRRTLTSVLVSRCD